MDGPDPFGPDEPQDTAECELCGRPLRNPESRRRGRGRVCDEKVNPGAGPGRDHSPRPGPARRTAPDPAVPNLLDVLEEMPCAAAE